MQRTELENIIESNDKQGLGIYDAIKRDDEIRLKELADIASDDQFTAWVKNATECKSWNCLIYLIRRIPKNNNYESYYLNCFSQALVIACRENVEPFINAVYRCSSYNYSNIFYEYGFFRNPPSIDPSNGYTALHWCVIHDNRTLLRLTYHNYSFLYLTDNNHRTPLDLAIMLNKVSFIHSLANHMSLIKLAFNMAPGTFKYLIQHNITLGRTFSDDHNFSKSTIKNKLVELIDELDDTTKERALNQALDHRSCLGALLLGASDIDHTMQLLLAQKLLTLIENKEQESKKKKVTPLSSTTLIHTNLYTQPDEIADDTNLLTLEPVLEPIYIKTIKTNQIPDYLNTKQFRAIFPAVPDTIPPKKTEEKPKSPLFA